mgnify:CR=1 FL=1
MSILLPPLSHRDHLQHVQAQPRQHHHLSLTRFGTAQTFSLHHYAAYLVLHGELRFQLDMQRCQVRAGQFMLINAHQPVQVVPEGDHQVLCLHLAPEGLKDALRQRTQAADWQQVAACLQPEGQPELCEQVYEAAHDVLGRYLLRLADNRPHAEATWPEDLAQLGAEAAHYLIDAQITAYRQLLNLTSAKLSTKRELYRRLCLARMHMHTHLDEALDLDTLAQVACLSKYHFIRLFKEAFGETPRQYLIARRLERASSLLIHSHLTFHEICQEVGLKDSSSFGRLFKRNFGATPHLYRQMHAG